MTYKTLDSNLTGDGLRDLLNFPNLDNSLVFYPLILFAIFFIVTTLTFFRELNREGKANILPSLAVAGFVTSAMAVLFSLIQVISTATLITTLVICIVFIGLFLLTKKQ